MILICSCQWCTEKSGTCFRCDSAQSGQRDLTDWLGHHPEWYPVRQIPLKKPGWHKIPNHLEGWYGPPGSAWIVLCPECVQILKKERAPR